MPARRKLGLRSPRHLGGSRLQGRFRGRKIRMCVPKGANTPNRAEIQARNCKRQRLTAQQALIFIADHEITAAGALLRRASQVLCGSESAISSTDARQTPSICARIPESKRNRPDSRGRTSSAASGSIAVRSDERGCKTCSERLGLPGPPRDDASRQPVQAIGCLILRPL